MVTQLYASVATGFFILLTLRVFALRGNPIFKIISYGKENEDILRRAVRGHGNFIEYTPLFLILLYLAENAGTQSYILHILAIIFMFGRLLHGILFSFLIIQSFILRATGMFLTMLGIGLVGLLNFIQYILVYF
tara:strand:- start:146 stop:547 length:402 start_codon:yes stop_codon:yes gene_type:complete